MEVLGGEVDLDVDGFEMVLEPEFTLVLVKVKGLGGAGALSEPIDSNSSFPVTLTLSMVFCHVGNFAAHAGLQIKHVLFWVGVAYLWLGDLNGHTGYKFGELFGCKLESYCVFGL